MKKLRTKIQLWYGQFSPKNINGSAKKPDEEKKSQDNEQTLEDLGSANIHSQAKCQLVQTSYIKRIKFFFFAI